MRECWWPLRKRSGGGKPRFPDPSGHLSSFLLPAANAPTPHTSSLQRARGPGSRHLQENSDLCQWTHFSLAFHPLPLLRPQEVGPWKAASPSLESPRTPRLACGRGLHAGGAPDLELTCGRSLLRLRVPLGSPGLEGESLCSLLLLQLPWETEKLVNREKPRPQHTEG